MGGVFKLDDGFYETYLNLDQVLYVRKIVSNSKWYVQIGEFEFYVSEEAAQEIIARLSKP